jgi:serine/arginine repetitive matrix protein 2
MPLTPQQYLEWWLTDSLDPLKELMDKETLELAPQHAGFDTHIGRRLRNFDNDAQLREALRLHVKRFSFCQASDLSSNPRNKLRELTLTVFKKSEDGGLDLKAAMQGLSELNMVELRRRRLVAETPLTFKPNHAAFGSAAMIQELNKKATEKFGQFYVGFRASVSRAQQATRLFLVG